MKDVDKDYAFSRCLNSLQTLEKLTLTNSLQFPNNKDILFPDYWKIARVAPVFKDGPADESSKYRPISVLLVVSRLFEKLICDQLYHYLDSNKLIFGKRSAYRQLHSVLSCLL